MPVDYAGRDGQSLNLSESSQLYLLIWIIIHCLIDSLPFILLRYDLFNKSQDFVKIIATSSIIQKIFQCISILAFNPVTSWLEIIFSVTGLLVIALGNLRLVETYTEKSHPFMLNYLKIAQKVTVVCFFVFNSLIIIRVCWLGIAGPLFIYNYEGLGIMLFVGFFFLSSVTIYVFIAIHLFELVAKVKSIRKRTLVNRESIRKLFLAVLGILIFQIALGGIILYLVGFTSISPQIMALLANTVTWNANFLVMAMFLLERLAVPVCPPSSIDLIQKAQNAAELELEDIDAE